MQLTAYNSRQHQQMRLDARPLKLGRDPLLVDWVLDDPRMSELQLTVSVEEQAGVQRAILLNHGRSVVLQSGRRILGGASCTLEPYDFFWVGETCFSLTPSSVPANRESLSTLPSLNGQLSGDQVAELLGQSPAAMTLIHWLQSIGKLQRSVGASAQLFADAAHAVFDPGGLDGGMIITRRGGELRIDAAFISNPELGIAFDPEVVEECLDRRQTVFHNATVFEKPDCVLRNAVVAAPIFDHDGQTAGVVYGSRSCSRHNFRRGIRPLEAQFIQVIAENVTAGMVRLAKEADAARTRVQFEQVFSPKLVEVLQRDPGMLSGDEREVTVMFCDMPASTAITRLLQPRELYHLLGDVMDCLTNQIIRQDGVVIDYFGDGLAAFWNAPVEQSDHAQRAVTAGLEILKSLPDLNDSWRGFLGRNIQVHIGVHTGIALVGNAGSRMRMKYGPRGNSVHLAARIEAETRRVGVPFLISAATREKVTDQFVTQRIFRSALDGFEGEYDLYQPFDPRMDVRELERIRKYEQALLHYEQQEYIDTLDLLIDLEAEQFGGAATEFLMTMTREAMKSNPTGKTRIAFRPEPRDFT